MSLRREDAMNRASVGLLVCAIGGALAMSCNATRPAGSAEAGDSRSQEAPAVAGIVKDEAGNAIANLTVQACTVRVCLLGKTDADGRFTVAGLEPPVDVAVKTPENDAMTPFRAESIAPVRLVNNSTVDVGTLYVFTLLPVMTLGPTSGDPQEIALGDGLTLTLRRSDLTMPLGVTDDDQLAARSIALEHVPKLAELGSEKVVAVYALFPFATKSKSKISIRLPTTLPPGTKVRLRTIGELDGKLSAAESGTSDGKFVIADPGAGIFNLTWLVVSQ
jgi:hypothetical protein